MTKLVYRVHYADGHKIDVKAETSAEAMKTGQALHPAHILKVKVVREKP